MINCFLSRYNKKIILKNEIIIFLFISLFLLCACVEESDFPLENEIMASTNATFDKATHFSNVLCGHCKKLKPELKKEAATLRK